MTYFLLDCPAFFLVGVFSTVTPVPFDFYGFDRVVVLINVFELMDPNPLFLLKFIGLYLPFLNFLLDSYNKV